MKESQTKQIYEYLKGGNKITALEALRRFGCLRLSARIYDIRKDCLAYGECLVTRPTTQNGKKFVEYSIGKI